MICNLEILYEDNHVIVVNKPAGMLSQGDLSQDVDVLTVVKNIIKQRDKKPGNVYLGLLHRLDRPVGGAMILAKNSKAAGRLSLQFRKRETKKKYRAICLGTPSEKESALKHWLKKDRASRTTRVVKETEGGKLAELNYRVIACHRDLSLVEIDLLTGLPHQIRAQLSAIGHPILGDNKYSAAPVPSIKTKRGTIALYSHSIGFNHPVKKDFVLVTAHPPNCVPWTDENLPFSPYAD